MNRILVFIFNEKIAKINSSRMQIIYLKRRNFEIYNFVITIGFTNLKLSCIMFMYRNIVIVFLWVIYFYYYNQYRTIITVICAKAFSSTLSPHTDRLWQGGYNNPFY